MNLGLKSTILCARTLEIVTLVDYETLDDLEQLQIQQDKSACRALLRQPWSAAMETCTRWIKIFCGDRFVGAMGIEQHSTWSNTSDMHFFLIGKNREIARAVVIGVILHEQFKGNTCRTYVPAHYSYRYMHNFLENCGCYVSSEKDDRVVYRMNDLQPHKHIRSFFAVPFPIPSTTTQEE